MAMGSKVTLRLEDTATLLLKAPRWGRVGYYTLLLFDPSRLGYHCL